jgi:hypothetical protein
MFAKKRRTQGAILVNYCAGTLIKESQKELQRLIHLKVRSTHGRKLQSLDDGVLVPSSSKLHHTQLELLTKAKKNQMLPVPSHTKQPQVAYAAAS